METDTAVVKIPNPRLFKPRLFKQSLIKQFVKGKANHRTVGIAIRASDLQEQFVLIIYKTVDQNGSAPS